MNEALTENTKDPYPMDEITECRRIALCMGYDYKLPETWPMDIIKGIFAIEHRARFPRREILFDILLMINKKGGGEYLMRVINEVLELHPNAYINHTRKRLHQLPGGQLFQAGNSSEAAP